MIVLYYRMDAVKTSTILKYIGLYNKIFVLKKFGPRFKVILIVQLEGL